MTAIKYLAYFRLMRLDKPIGTLLLLWPTLIALWLAVGGIPTPSILAVFITGVFLMRAAGCVINDFADRHFDGNVPRTANRPLVKGEIKEKESKQLFFLLIFLAFILVLTLNGLTISLSIIALALAWIYPFMKRITYLPQFILGLAYSWTIPMAYAAVTHALPLSCWLLFMANICWTVAYDTEYAMVDRLDDLKIGIKSTAILFAQWDRLFIGVLQTIMLLLFVAIALLNHLSILSYIILAIVALLFIYQQKLIKNRIPKACFQAFMNNNYVGMLLFFAIAISR